MKNINKLFTLYILIVWSLPSLAVIAGPDEETPKFSDDVVASVGDQPVWCKYWNEYFQAASR